MALKYPASLSAVDVAYVQQNTCPPFHSAPYSIKMWVKIQAILGWGGIGTITYDYHGDPIWTAEGLEFAWDAWRLWSASDIYTASDPPAGTIKRWVCWMIVRKETALEWWIDGKLHASNDSSAYLGGTDYGTSYSDTFGISRSGSDASHAGIFGGYYCRWTRPLTEDEVRIESRSIVPLNRRGLWQQVDLEKIFVGSTGEFFYDVSGNKHHMKFGSTSTKPVYDQRVPNNHLCLDYLPDAAQFARPIADIRTGNWKAI